MMFEVPSLKRNESTKINQPVSNYKRANMIEKSVIYN